MTVALVIAGWLLVINVAAYASFAIDKARARQAGARRVSERTLLRLAALGGSPGAVFAQQRLRHKSYKQPFRTYLWLIIVAQVLALSAFAAWETFSR